MTARRAAVGAFVVLAAAQIAIPLTDDRATIEWLSTLVVVAFAATTLALAAAAWGWQRAGAAVGFVATATLAVERLGTTTGVPFGEYHYTGALTPTVGDVPVIVPLAWFAMAVPALVMGRHLAPGRTVLTVGAGAVALTAWDLFLDPQMVDAGYWEWAADGAYEGIPLSNYAGWLVTGLGVVAVLDRLLPAAGASRGAAGPQATTGLVALYGWWSVMNTIGFVVFFGRPFVGLVGGVGMGAVCAATWASWSGRRG